ncbi:HupE/UreJ family protein [Methylophilus aquaticus]|uniref:HupE/UreJ family protein n=1 Tax=Methylophilus aquaticus TaxID=1971610 RepID=A0ABT9JVZ5_9PROT|nr:HupE/UreJ family protein [Methylophilus aquaticus]MDP8568757.1 HupE/UreJ family protein [Methylophilus aquaticus]
MKKNMLLALAAFTASTSAFAHPGHGLESGFAAGLMHPLTGWDHLLVMVALGIWAARRPAAQGWQLPVLFVSVMALAASAAMTWLPVSLAEALVAASVVIMGVLLISPLQMPRALQISVISIAAAAHGYVHGMEIGNQWSGLAGMVLATAMLHALGWVLGRQTHPQLQKATQLLGGVMLGLGAMWMLA